MNLEKHLSCGEQTRIRYRPLAGEITWTSFYFAGYLPSQAQASIVTKLPTYSLHLRKPGAMSMDIDDDSARQLRPEQEKELTRLWRTWRTVLEMLVDRVCAPRDSAASEPHTDMQRDPGLRHLRRRSNNDTRPIS